MEILLFVSGLILGIILTCIVFGIYFINKFNKLCDVKANEFVKKHLTFKVSGIGSKDILEMQRQMHKDFNDDWRKIVEDFHKTLNSFKT